VLALIKITNRRQAVRGESKALNSSMNTVIEANNNFPALAYR